MKLPGLRCHGWNMSLGEWTKEWDWLWNSLASALRESRGPVNSALLQRDLYQSTNLGNHRKQFLLTYKGSLQEHL
jgi:hypothetical protein